VPAGGVLFLKNALSLAKINKKRAGAPSFNFKRRTPPPKIVDPTAVRGGVSLIKHPLLLKKIHPPSRRPSFLLEISRGCGGVGEY